MVLMKSRCEWFRKCLFVSCRTVAIFALGNMCVGMLTLLPGTGPRVASNTFSGAQALAFTRQVVSFGARPPRSPGTKKLHPYILGDLKAGGCHVMQHDFTAS